MEQEHFALEMQHEGEPGVWVEEFTLPWHGKNLDSLIKVTAEFQDNIRKVLAYVNDSCNKRRARNLPAER